MQTRRVARPGYRSRHSARTRWSARRFTLTAAAVLVLVGASGTALWHQLGLRVYVVHTGSMEPNYNPGDVVVDEPVHGSVHPGEVITFRHSDTATDVVTHRVVAVTRSGLIHTKGDANRTADVWEIRPDQVQGHATHRIKDLGYVLVFLRQPAGIGSLAAGLFAIVLLWGIFFPGARDGADAAEEDAAESSGGGDERPTEDGADEPADEASRRPRPPCVAAGQPAR